MGLCPQCGAKGLFDGLTRFAPQCKSCGLDYGQFNVGDGPAAFLTLIVGALSLGLALWIEFTLEPPLWLLLALLTPVVAATTILGLRIAKAALLAAEYRRKAGEGRIKDQ